MSIPLTSKRTIPFHPADLRDKHPEIYFDIRVPNYQDRDELGLKLYRLGTRQIDQSNIKTAMIDHCFVRAENAAVTPEDLEAAEAVGEKDAVFLENFWSQQDLDNADLSAWNDQERERLLDIAGLMKAGTIDDLPKAAPKPELRTTARQRNLAAKMIQEIVVNSTSVRDMLADQQAYDLRYRHALVRLHLAGIHGLPATLSLSGGLVTDQCIEALREALSSKSAIAYTELIDEIESLYELPKVEVGNSDSPPVNSMVEEPSSPAQSGASDDSDGSSTKPVEATTSDTAPIPDDASQTTTETSSAPSLDVEANTVPSDGPTTDPYSTSRHDSLSPSPS